MFVSIVLVFLLLHAAFGAALGFFVLKLADKEEKSLRTIGFVIGGVIIALSLALMAIACVSTLNEDVLHRSECCLNRIKQPVSTEKTSIKAFKETIRHAQESKSPRVGCRIEDLK